MAKIFTVFFLFFVFSAFGAADTVSFSVDSAVMQDSSRGIISVKLTPCITDPRFWRGEIQTETPFGAQDVFKDTTYVLSWTSGDEKCFGELKICLKNMVYRHFAEISNRDSISVSFSDMKYVLDHGKNWRIISARSR